jgi:hypothetical protein
MCITPPSYAEVKRLSKKMCVSSRDWRPDKRLTLH